METLAGKRVVVVGGSSGLGLGIVEEAVGQKAGFGEGRALGFSGDNGTVSMETP